MLRLYIPVLIISPILLISQFESAIGFEDCESKLKIIYKDTAFNGPRIESIELKKRNWENHGIDVMINNRRNWKIVGIYLGRSKKITEGYLTQEQMNDLSQLLETSRFCELQNEYKGSLKTEFSWWGYQLTVKTTLWEKSVRFHSEDDTVPEKLKEFIEFIMALTK